MMRGPKVLSALSCLALVACGGSSPQAESPADEYGSETQEPAAFTPAEAPEREAEEPAREEQAAVPEPQFTSDMSVDDAIKAVPQGVERRNIDAETLAKPLSNAELYEACKAKGAKFKVRVAVWDGRAVGVDVTSTPKNDRASECVKANIRNVTWEKQVKSLNTVEYQF